MAIFSNFRNWFKINQYDRESWFRLFGWNLSHLPNNTKQLLEQGYEKNLDIYAIINKIILGVVSGNWVVERVLTDGTVEEITDSDLHALIDNPNKSKGYTWDDIDQQVALFLLATGNSYMIGESGVFSSKIQEVDILPPEHVTIQTNNDWFMPEPKYQFSIGTERRTFEKDQVEHIKYFNPSYNSVQESLYGLSPIQVAAMAVRASNNRWEADAAILENRGAIGLLSDESERPNTPIETKEIQQGFDRDTTGPGMFGKVKVTNKAVKYIPMAMSSTDLQLLEKGVVNLRSLCNVFGVDSSLFNDPENKTFNNRAQATKDLYTQAVIPLANKIAHHHTRFLARNYFPEGNVRMRLDFEHIEALQKDKNEEAVKDRIEIEGIKAVMELPIPAVAKVELLKERYEVEEQLALLMVSSESNTGDKIEENSQADQARIQSQANLRGSVGGVQGILGIQASVAQGVTSLEAAVVTLIEIYGFDDQTARLVLGKPKDNEAIQ